MIRFLEFIAAVGRWLQLFIAAALVGGISALIINSLWDAPVARPVSIAVFAVFCVAGLILATRLWKKSGTMEVLQKGKYRPELDPYVKEPGSDDVQRS